MTATALPAGPKGHFLTGNIGDFGRDRLGFIVRCVREYGDFVPLRFGNRRVYFLNHPDLIEQMLVTAGRSTIKSPGLRSTRPVLGNGLLLSEGDFWRRQRKLAQPAFHRERIAAYGEIMVAYTERRLCQWQDGETRDITEEMMHLTLEIVAKTLFDAEVTHEADNVVRALEVTREAFLRRTDSLFPWPEWFPTPEHLRVLRAVRQLDAIIYGIIARRRASGRDQGDFLSMLLQAQDEDDGSRMTDRQLRDEALTLFLAGHETTAIALSWMLYLLAQHPEVDAKLVAELETVLGDRAPRTADRPLLRYTEMVVTEAMRLYPPAWGVGREAVGDFEIGGYPIRKGNILVASQWAMHRDPRWFENPEAFRPERWENDFAKTLPKYAYFPFGGGQRVCIGNTFAQMEAILLLAAIARQFRFGLASAEPVLPKAYITLRPAGPIRLTLCRRQ